MPATLETHPPAEEPSGEVQDVMSAVPHTIVRWGITVVFAVVGVLLVMSWLVQYPDVITSRLSVTSQNPPASVVAPISGKLARLCVKEGQSVTNGAVLAVIESAADIDAVAALQAALETFAAQQPEAGGALAFPFDPAARLGEIQPAYSEFLSSHRQHNSLLTDPRVEEKITLIEKQITQTGELIVRLQAQQKLLLRDRELADDNFAKVRQLSKEKVLSPVALAEAETASLARQRDCAAAENTIVSTRIQLLEYEKAISDLRQQRDEQQRQARVAVLESFKKLRAQAAIWELQHVFKAPVDGAVAFFKYWSPHQHVQAQDEVMTIVPATGRLLGRIALKEHGAGKIRAGQTVRVKLDDYPAQEYGTVSATVESLSPVPRDNTYLVNLRFDAGLKTSYGKTLACKQEMQGEADIVTAKRRLIERVFGQLRHLVVQTSE